MTDDTTQWIAPTDAQVEKAVNKWKELGKPGDGKLIQLIIDQVIIDQLAAMYTEETAKDIVEKEKQKDGR